LSYFLYAGIRPLLSLLYLHHGGQCLPYPSLSVRAQRPEGPLALVFFVLLSFFKKKVSFSICGQRPLLSLLRLPYGGQRPPYFLLFCFFLGGQSPPPPIRLLILF
jgi:hypothetical protein